MTGPARRAAVLGSPIGHSLSPVLHRAAYDTLGLSGWEYHAAEVTEDGLADFLAGLDDTWAGLSLTMPLKAAVLPLLDSRSATVDHVGAANTVVLRRGRRAGHNTDVPGLVAALATAGVDAAHPVPRAVVLGGGATARSALAALAGLAGHVEAYVRTPARAVGLEATATAVGIGLSVQPWERAAAGLAAPIVVATTPAGSADPLAAAVPDAPGLLLDVVYHPWPTRLAAAWQAAGGRVVGGLELLVQQAVRQVELLTGAPVDRQRLTAAMRAAGQAALAGRPGGRNPAR